MTRLGVFLERMDGLILGERREAHIRPFYPRAGRGPASYPLSAMLRIHCLQLFYDMSDPGMEGMLYDVELVRRFAGLRLSGPIPDETAILNFRHLLEATNDLGLFWGIGNASGAVTKGRPTGLRANAPDRCRSSE